MAELIGPLSLATDAANGMGPETAMRTSLLAVALARAHGLSGEVLHDVYWTAVLRFLGCTSFAPETAHRYGAGDDIALLRELLAVDGTRPSEVLRGAARASAQRPLRARAAALGRLVTDRDAGQALARAHCDAASALANDLGAREATQHALGQIHERWDGRGAPLGLAGDAIGIVARVVQVAHRAEVHRAISGPDDAMAEVARRAGTELEPALAQRFASFAGEVLPALSGSVFSLFVEAEPAPRWWMGPDDVGGIAGAFARYADLKSTFTLGHSTGVASLAVATARTMGIAGDALRDLELAALLHDLGRTAIPNAIWDAPRPLDRLERDRAESHAHHTYRILSVSPVFESVARLAGAAHVRQDGSGYPSRGTAAGSDILAACDVIHALGEERPHRARHAPEEIARIAGDEVRAHRLDRRAVDAALAARGIASSAPGSPLPDGLSEREAEVLCLLARGSANKDIAQALGLSPKTVQHHVAHIYDKTAVRTRAAAALYAVRRGLI